MATTNGGASAPAVTELVPTIDDRIAVAAAHRAGFETSNRFHQDARAFRNRLVVMTLIALFAALALGLLQALIPSAAILTRPDDANGIVRWQLLAMVMVFGAIGALLTTIPAMSSIPRVKSPFNFPLQQAYLKIIVGALTAVVGVVVTGGSAISTGFRSIGALISAAVVFGAAQQVVTQFLDKRAGQIIDQTST